MTELFTRIPVWLFLDGGVRALPAPARVALYELAANGGSARCGDDPTAVLDGLCAGAGALLDVMLDRGVVALDGARIVLMAPDGSPSSVGAPRPASAPPPSTPHQPTSSRRTDDRAAVQRLGALWSKASLVTFEARAAWLDSAAGARYLEREGRDRAWVLDLASRNPGVNRGRFGQRVDAATASTAASTLTPVAASTTASTVDRVDRNHGANRGVNPSLPPGPPLPEKNEERSPERAGAHGVNRGVNRLTELTATAASTTTPGHGVNLTASTLAAPRLPSAERPAGVDGKEVAFELRGAGLRLSLSTAHEAELERAIAGVTPAWTRESVRRLAEHVRAGHLRDGWKPVLSHLRGRDASWTVLLSLHDEAQGCGRCSGTHDDGDDPWEMAERKGVVT